MVCVYAAIAAKVMLCGFSIELVKLQNILAFDDFDAGQRNRRNDCAFAPAQ